MKRTDASAAAASLSQILPFAEAFAQARKAERSAHKAWEGVRAAGRRNTPAHRRAVEAQDALIRTRRELADVVVRVLLRGHPADCSCRTCSRERALCSAVFLNIPPAPARKARR